MLPNKFNKKLWIKRGGYLIIQHGDVDPQHSVTGTITSVLYDQDIRHLKSLQGVWWVAEHPPQHPLLLLEGTSFHARARGRAVHACWIPFYLYSVF